MSVGMVKNNLNKLPKMSKYGGLVVLPPVLFESESTYPTKEDMADTMG